MDVAWLIPLTPTQSEPSLEETQHLIEETWCSVSKWDTCINSGEMLLLLLGTLVLLAEQHWWGGGGEVCDPDQATITYWSLTVWPPSWTAKKQ